MRTTACAVWAMSACLALLASSGCTKEDDDPEGQAQTIDADPAETEGEDGLEALGFQGAAATVSGLGEVDVEEQMLSPGEPSTGANLGTAMCDAEDTVIGGGCDCNGQVLIGTRMEDKGWSCACVAGAAQKAFAVCADQTIKVSSVSVAFPGQSNEDASTECPQGTQLISVGAHCGFTGPNGPEGPSGEPGQVKSVLPRDATRVDGYCGSARVGGGVEATLYGYCIANAVAELEIVATPSSSSSQCGDGTAVVGGGCQCHDPDHGPLQAAYIDKNGFACSCKNDAANETIAICATQ